MRLVGERSIGRSNQRSSVIPMRWTQAAGPPLPGRPSRAVRRVDGWQRVAIGSPDQLSVAACCGTQLCRVLLSQSAKWRELEMVRCRMKAIVVTDEAAGTAGMTLVERPEPEPAINEVVVQVH